MSEQEEVRKDKPCIFSNIVTSMCPVRKELAELKGPDLSKWIKSSEKMFDEAEKLIEKFTDRLGYEYNTLVSFCDVCPFLQIYINHMAPSS